MKGSKRRGAENEKLKASRGVGGRVDQSQSVGGPSTSAEEHPGPDLRPNLIV